MEMIQLIPEQIIQESMYHLLHIQRKMKETGAIENQDTFCGDRCICCRKFWGTDAGRHDWKINIEGVAVGK